MQGNRWVMVNFCKGFLCFCSRRLPEISYALLYTKIAESCNSVLRMRNYKATPDWYELRAIQKKDNVRLASITGTPLPCASVAGSVTHKLIMQGVSCKHSGVKSSRTRCYFQCKNRAAASITYLLQIT